MKAVLSFILFTVNTAVAADVSHEQYLIVEDEVRLPSGQVLGQFGVTLIHWRPDTVKGLVTETIHIISKRRDNRQICADSKDMLLEVRGLNVVITENGIGVIGSGVLTGSGWNWESLQFEVRSNGRIVSGTDYFGTEEWASEKNVLDANGNVSVKVAGRLRPITQDTYFLLLPKGLPSCE